jgi:hypothetical protein
MTANVVVYARTKRHPLTEAPRWGRVRGAVPRVNAPIGETGPGGPPDAAGFGGPPDAAGFGGEEAFAGVSGVTAWDILSDSVPPFQAAALLCRARLGIARVWLGWM